MADDTTNEPLLTDEERKRVRALLKQDDHIMWLWSFLGSFVKWGLIFGAGATAFWQALNAIVHTTDKLPK